MANVSQFDNLNAATSGRLGARLTELAGLPPYKVAALLFAEFEIVVAPSTAQAWVRRVQEQEGV